MIAWGKLRRTVGHCNNDKGKVTACGAACRGTARPVSSSAYLLLHSAYGLMLCPRCTRAPLCN